MSYTQQQVLFEGADGDIVFGTSVSGFPATVQNALTIIGTSAGSDGIFPDKGTTLLQDAVSGLVVQGNQAVHVSNIAAVDTLFFIKSGMLDPSDPDELASIVLQPGTLLPGARLSIQAVFTSVSGVSTPSSPTF